jgi:hypothetical protein
MHDQLLEREVLARPELVAGRVEAQRLVRAPLAPADDRRDRRAGIRHGSNAQRQRLRPAASSARTDTFDSGRSVPTLTTVTPSTPMSDPKVSSPASAVSGPSPASSMSTAAGSLKVRPSVLNAAVTTASG